MNVLLHIFFCASEDTYSSILIVPIPFLFRRMLSILTLREIFGRKLVLIGTLVGSKVKYSEYFQNYKKEEKLDLLFFFT